MYYSNRYENEVNKTQQIGTVFRCCLPCRGGKKAPATISPDSDNSTSDPLYQCDTIVHDGEQPKTLLSNSKAKLYHQDHNIQQAQTDELQNPHESIQSTQYTSIQHQQQSPLPHIEEEEESPQISPEDEVCGFFFLFISIHTFHTKVLFFKSFIIIWFCLLLFFSFYIYLGFE